VLLPLQVHFLRDAAEIILLSVQRKHVLFRRCFLPKFLVMSIFVVIEELSSCVAVLSNVFAL
jgi:hypothetical protein